MKQDVQEIKSSHQRMNLNLDVLDCTTVELTPPLAAWSSEWNWSYL